MNKMKYILPVVFVIMFSLGFVYQKNLNNNAKMAEVEYALADMQLKIDALQALANEQGVPIEDVRVGADGTGFAGLSTYYLSGSGITSSASSIGLTLFTIKQTGQELALADFGNTIYLTLEPGSATRQEFVQCTGLSQGAGTAATLSGCTRGHQPIPDYSASTTLRFPHSGGTAIIVSNSPSFYNQFAVKNNDETISGLWTYSVLPVSSLIATGSTQFVTKQYVDGGLLAGAATGTESVTGIVRLATALQAASSTASTANTPLALQAQYATDTPTRGCAVGYTGTVGAGCSVIATLAGKIKQTFLDIFTTDNSWTGKNNFTASTSLPFFYGDGSDGAVTITSGTTTLTRDMHYSSLTINSGTTIDPNGFKIFVTGTLTNNGRIASYGNTGGTGGNGANGVAITAGVGGAAGAASSQMTSGTLAGAGSGLIGTAGSGGGNGSSGGSGGGTGTIGNAGAAGTAGTVGETKTSCIGTAPASSSGTTGGTGGAGGSGNAGGPSTGGAGAAGGGAGVCSLFSRLQVFPTWLNVYEMASTILTALSTAKAPSMGSAGGGGGGGSGNTGGQDGGGGGGGGGTGGTGTTGRIIAIYAYTLTNNGEIISIGGKGGIGGNGGTGANGSGGNSGGGGGGAAGSGGNGGTGGVIILVYKTLTTGTLTLTGGIGGLAGSVCSGGTGTGSGTAGSNGAAGATGVTGATGTTYLIAQ